MAPPRIADTSRGMNVVLLRVGIDGGCGGAQGPLFPDGTFEFVCMPDDTGTDPRTYSNLTGACGRPLVELLPASRRARLAHQSVHVDPEFATFTYGDPTRPKAGLARLRPGDLLVFYAGLEGVGFDSPPALYVVGYFEVALAGRARDWEDAFIRREFAENFHVRHPAIYDRDKRELILIKGGPSSRRLLKAHRISEMGSDANGKPLKVLSAAAREVFGTFGGCNSIQRSPPRWVRADFVDRAAASVRGLP
jgi:hypothetical protein